MFVTGVITQGNPQYPQWVTGYKISYSNTTNGFQFVNYLDGNQVVSKLFYDSQIFLNSEV